jgi:hypothetical protein
MRLVFKSLLIALLGAALTAGPLAAEPHGGGFGGDHGGGRGANFGGDRGGFAGSHGDLGARSFGGSRGDFGPRNFGGSRGDFGARGASSRFDAGARSAFHGDAARFAGEGASRHGQTFAGGNRGDRFGAGRMNLAAPHGDRGAFNTARNGVTPAGFRDRGVFGGSRAASAFAGSPAGLGFRDAGFRNDFDGGFAGWRGGWGDRDEWDWDDWVWPLGFDVLAFSVDWTLGDPCPYWYWRDWGCAWGPPYPAYWAAGYWGPGYAWGPAYAGPVFYDWDDDWRPAVYAEVTPVEYAYWSPADVRSPTYYYADYSPGGCVGRHYVWDPGLGAYVTRTYAYPC